MSERGCEITSCQSVEQLPCASPGKFDAASCMFDRGMLVRRFCTEHAVFPDEARASPGKMAGAERQAIQSLNDDKTEGRVIRQYGPY